MKLLERDAAYLWDMLDAAKTGCRTLGWHRAGRSLTISDPLRDRAGALDHRRSRATGFSRDNSSPSGIPWKGIIGFRNVLAHEYGAIDYHRLYTVLGTIS